MLANSNNSKNVSTNNLISLKNSLKKNNTENQEEFQNILINKSNKSLIFKIQIFLIVMISLLVIVVCFISYKFIYIVIVFYFVIILNFIKKDLREFPINCSIS